MNKLKEQLNKQEKTNEKKVYNFSKKELQEFDDSLKMYTINGQLTLDGELKYLLHSGVISLTIHNEPIKTMTDCQFAIKLDAIDKYERLNELFNIFSRKHKKVYKS